MPDLLQILADALYATGGLFTVMEIALVGIAAAMVLLRPHLGARLFEAIEIRGARIAHRRWVAVLVVGAAAIAMRALALAWVGIPDPLVHDEHSIWLQGQTFAAGRMANPTHPLWEHFETFYVNHVPAYASMYFPGRGAPLALGFAMFGDPWIGVWLSMVLLCMATTWMLQGWVSPGLALLGGLIVAVRLGVLSFWVNSYYGGAIIAFGATLVVGALPRLLREPRWTQGLVMGLGAAILMVSRPYEGALLCAPVGLLLAWRFARPRLPATRKALAHAFVPAIACIAAGAALLVSYNLATTQNALKTPYGLNRATYASAPAFVVADAVPSAQRGPQHFRDYFAEEAEPYERTTSALQVARGIVGKVGYTWNFYVGLTFLAAFLAGLWSSRRDGFLLGTSGFFMAGYALVTWNFPQYTAPLMPILMVIMMRGFQWLASTGNPLGLGAARMMPTVAVVLLMASLGVAGAAPQVFSGSSPQAPCCKVDQPNLRQQINARLASIPGRDLVLVLNSPHNPLTFELVNNDPDIDQAPVVWAHRLGDARDERLLQYFSDRVVWTFEWAPDAQAGFHIALVRQQERHGQAAQK
ncbi:hypothetical protein [Ramlibacter tataouinensis]|uniref:Candidate membrane protein n=1 Tax=Ramlibacter tataouinensis (strain ATCC BAA-407 / DSM 14655 / LMG 21543 / TTB310) TaxID=365046 RepID=F5Y4N6_RAMTT|nr:hypothetical protein [Ramlibacter tataouinensis]AEG91354.1 candidate membrane protein [Ramlibacter tataouinensis TTB310]